MPSGVEFRFEILPESKSAGGKTLESFSVFLIHGRNVP